MSVVGSGTAFLMARNGQVRGEFFNVGNRPKFGGPGTGLNTSTYGFVTPTQANDAHIGQITARVNF